jgi:histidyl-tRNA synthetase
MREANRQKAEKVLIIGEEEMKKGKAALKDMQSGEQEEIDLDHIADAL